MLLRSPTDRAYVDLSDGYSFLPDIPSDIAFKPARLEGYALSTVLHELSHQYALKGPLGMVFAAQHAARRTMHNMLAVARKIPQSDSTLLPMITTPCKAHISNTRDLVGCYKYLLEGMAIFTQIDFRISKQNECVSPMLAFLSI